LPYGYSYKATVPHRVKTSFAIFDAQAERQCPDVKNYKWRLKPVWHRMLYSCKHVATVGVKGLNGSRITISDNYSQSDVLTG